MDVKRAAVIQNMRRVMKMIRPALDGVSIPAKSRGWSIQQKASHWKAIDRRARSWEEPFKRGARRVFEAEKREVLALLKRAQKKALTEKATINWEWMGDQITEYYNVAGDLWRKVYTPLVKGLVSDQGKYWSASTGMSFDAENLFARDWFNNYLLKFSDAVTDTSEREIAALLNQGMREGWSIPEMQKHIESLFEQWMDGDVSPEDWEFAEQRLPPWRTEMIGRTETIRASNAGNHELFVTWKVKKREWLSTKDDRTRTLDKGDAFDHLAMDGVVEDIDKPFMVPGEAGAEAMMYPGDPDGSLANFINCRCTEIPVLPEEVEGER